MIVRRLFRVVFYLALGILALITLFPWLWVLLSSFKQYVEIFSMPPTWLPAEPTLDNYRSALGIASEAYSSSILPAAFRNSLVVSLATTFVVLILSISAGYAFARLRFPLKPGFLIVLLGLRMIPAIVLILPIYLYMGKLGLLDTYGALIIAYTAFNIPFAVWLLSVFLQDVPMEIEDAARVDGCSRLRALMYVIVPIAAPAIATVATFVFLACWNEFIFAIILTSTPAAKTVPVALNDLQTGYEIRWGTMAAGAILQTIPAILFVLFAQKYIIQGMTLGAVKG